MNKNPICVYETDKISTVEKVFAREKVNTLVVLDDKKCFVDLLLIKIVCIENIIVLIK